MKKSTITILGLAAVGYYIWSRTNISMFGQDRWALGEHNHPSLGENYSIVDGFGNVDPFNLGFDTAYDEGYLGTINIIEPE